MPYKEVTSFALKQVCLAWAGKTCNKYTFFAPPPPQMFWIKIVFNFSWNDCNTQEKLKARGGKQGVRIMGDVPTTN